MTHLGITRMEASTTTLSMPRLPRMAQRNLWAVYGRFGIALVAGLVLCGILCSGMGSTPAPINAHGSGFRWSFHDAVTGLPVNAAQVNAKAQIEFLELTAPKGVH